mmetsp:Transcript_384/g.598  ORF Transcript_384/g.598 Transcript_384/m.598 type:complete len:225 (+) Transcript_384:615-1289(+)
MCKSLSGATTILQSVLHGAHRRIGDFGIRIGHALLQADIVHGSEFIVLHGEQCARARREFVQVVEKSTTSRSPSVEGGMHSRLGGVRRIVVSYQRQITIVGRREQWEPTGRRFPIVSRYRRQVHQAPRSRSVRAESSVHGVHESERPLRIDPSVVPTVWLVHHPPVQTAQGIGIVAGADAVRDRESPSPLYGRSERIVSSTWQRWEIVSDHVGEWNSKRHDRHV